MSYPKEAVDEAFSLLPAKMDTPMARVIHAAIGYQESKYLTRVQSGNGPARGYWQFEAGGGVKGIMLFGGKVTELAQAVCAHCGVTWDRTEIWNALAKDDALAAAFARLLMYTDAAPLPTTQDAAWEMYSKRVWRPGKPHPEAWPASWAFGLKQS